MTVWVRRAECRNCGSRGDTVLIRRKVGGSYRRAGGYRDRRICTDCVKVLAARATPGALSTSQWSNSELRRMVERLEVEEIRRE